MANPTKISVYSLPDLKNTSDDAIPAYLNSLKFTQSHLLADTRLAIGYSAFAICAACFYWDYKLGFEGTKVYTAAAVATYALLNAALTYWIWGVEAGKVYVGTSPGGEKIEIATATKKHVPIYELTITTYAAKKPKVRTTVKIARPFSGWFDEAGNFVALPFQQMFAGEVPVIGKADPGRAVVGKGGVDDALLLQKALKGHTPAGATGASVGGGDGTASSRKGGKGKKKA